VDSTITANTNYFEFLQDQAKRSGAFTLAADYSSSLSHSNSSLSSSNLSTSSNSSQPLSSPTPSPPPSPRTFALSSPVATPSSLSFTIGEVVNACRISTSRIRAVLFKYLADKIGLQASLSKQSHPNSNSGGVSCHSWNEIYTSPTPINPNPQSLGVINLLSQTGLILASNTQLATAYIQVRLITASLSLLANCFLPNL